MVPSGKSLLVWFAALAVWLAFGALLETVGVPAVALLLLDVLAVTAILWRIARHATAGTAGDFLMPMQEGPNALAPYGLAATWISGFGTVGLTAAILMNGPGSYALVAGIVGGLVIGQTILAPALAETGARSLTHWVRERFAGIAGGFMSVVLALTGLAILTVQFAFAALLGEALFDLPAYIPVLLTALLVIVVVLPGGQTTMGPAQAALYLLLFAGLIVPAFWFTVSETGIVVPYLAPGALLHEIAVAEAKMGIGREPQALAAVVLGLTALFGTLGLPHTMVRWPVERTGRNARWFAQRGTVLALLAIGVVPLFAIAARARILAAALETGIAPPLPASSVEALSAGLAVIDPPGWLLAALGTGGLAAILAAAASAVFLVAGSGGGDPERETAGGLLSRLRWRGGAAVALAAFGALVIPLDPLTAFFGLLAYAASALLAPVTLGLLWHGTTARGATAGTLAGTITLLAFAMTGWQAGALAGLAVSILATVLVSLATREPVLSPPVAIPPRLP